MSQLGRRFLPANATVRIDMTVLPIEPVLAKIGQMQQLVTELLDNTLSYCLECL
jgi:hypothetical protein